MPGEQGRLRVYDRDVLNPLAIEVFLIWIAVILLLWKKAEVHLALAIVAAIGIGYAYQSAYQTRAFYVVATLSTAFWTVVWGALAYSLTHDPIWMFVVGTFACSAAIAIHRRARDFLRNVDLR